MAKKAPRKSTKPSRSTAMTKMVTLTVGKPIITLMDAEAARVAMTHNQFLRAVLLWHMGRMQLQRSSRAPAPKLPSAREHKLIRSRLFVQDDVFAYLHGLANRGGNISRSALFSLILLRWVGVDHLKPLVETKADGTTTELGASMTVTFGRPLMMLVDQEAARMGMKRNQFFRAVLLWHMGRLDLQRIPTAAALALPSSSTKHPFARANCQLQPELHAYVHQLANRAGNVSRSAVLAVIVLRWLGVDLLEPSPVATL